VLVQKSLTDGFQESAALLLASLLAVRRTTDADAVEREALRLEPAEPLRAALQRACANLDGVTTSVTT